MLRLLADENFNGIIVRSVVKRMNAYSPANGCREYLNSCAHFRLAARSMRYSWHW